jgi:hypothetical protein
MAQNGRQMPDRAVLRRELVLEMPLGSELAV